MSYGHNNDCVFRVEKCGWLHGGSPRINFFFAIFGQIYNFWTIICRSSCVLRCFYKIDFQRRLLFVVIPRNPICRGGWISASTNRDRKVEVDGLAVSINTLVLWICSKIYVYGIMGTYMICPFVPNSGNYQDTYISQRI